MGLSVQGTALDRGDRAPVVAYSAVVDGHVVYAGVFDPELVRDGQVDRPRFGFVARDEDHGV